MTSEEQQARGGIAEAVDISVKLAGAALSITRRFTTDLAAQTVEVGKEAVETARSGRPAAEVGAVVVHGCVEAARKVLGVDEDLREVGDQMARVTRPVTSRMPEQVQSAISALPSVRGVSRSVEDVRRTLKRQGLELLRRSTLLDDPDEHPALALILAELSPDEARVVRFLATTGPHAVIDVVAHNPMTRKKREMLHHFSIVGREAGCIRPERTPLYLDNLHRLGLVEIRAYRLRSQPNYDLLYCQPEVERIRKPEGKLVRLKIVHKGVELSEFGKELFRRCLETDEHRICAVPDKL